MIQRGLSSENVAVLMMCAVKTKRATEESTPIKYNSMGQHVFDVSRSGPLW